MQNFFLTRILKWIGSKLDGYRTTIGGVGLILLGIVYIIPVMLPGVEGLPEGNVEKGWGSIALGFAALGIGGKIEKNTEKVVKNTAAVNN